MKKKLIIGLLLALLVLPLITLADFKPATLEKYGERVKVTSKIAADYYFSKGYKLESGKVGAVVSTGYRSKLTSSLTSNGTIISVSSNLDINGILLPCTATSRCYFNLEPGGARQEPVVCTGVGINTFTSCTRGLVATGPSETGSSTLAFAHNAGSTIVLTNIAQFYGNYVDNVSNQTVGGVKDFTYLPTSTTTFPTTDNQFVTKIYADALTLPTSYWGLNGTDVYRGSGSAGIGTSTPKDLLSLNANSGKGMSVYASSTGTKIAQFYNQSNNGGISLGTASTSNTILFQSNSYSYINPDAPLLGGLVVGTNVPHNSAAFTTRGTSTNKIVSILDSSGNELMNVASSSVTINSTLNIGTSTATTTFSGPVLNAGFQHITTYTSVGATTWNKPAGVYLIKVKVVGGGGDGGSYTNIGSSGGGGGGGYSEKIINVSATSSVLITVGGADGTSSFGSYLSATGGSNGGGGPYIGDGGAGGVGSGGDINSGGGGGGTGAYTPTVAITFSGAGGNSVLGGGGYGRGAAGSGNVINGNGGTNYGGGGSGGFSTNGGSGFSGGVGAQGIVIVEY